MQQVITSLLDPLLDKITICWAVLFSVASNSVFIVDLACLDNAKDVQCDDMGTWKDDGHFKCYGGWFSYISWKDMAIDTR